MHQPVESSTNGIEFRGRTTIPGNNMNWNIGTVTMPRRDAEAGKITLAAAKTKTGEPVMLWPTLLTSDGQVEGFQLITFRSGVKTEVPLNTVHTEAVGKMLDIANDEKLHGFAAEGSLRQGGGMVHVSHEIVVDGNKGTVNAVHFNNTDAPLAGIVTDDLTKKQSSLFILNVNDVDESGKITSSVVQTRGGESGWITAPEGSLAPRALEELTRFAEKHKHFGLAHAGYVAKVDDKVKDILSETDIDAGLAKLLCAHHEKTLDTALENGDFTQAKSASEQASSHREAVEKLGKPKGHLDRVKFEREQQLKVAENGDIERFSR